MRRSTSWLLFLFPVILHAQSEVPALDIHVHLMSRELCQNLALYKGGSELIQGDQVLYSDIDTIMALNNAQRVGIIATGYGYRTQGMSLEEEIASVRRENDWFYEVTKKYPGRIIRIYGIDPTTSYGYSELRRCHDTLELDMLKMHFHGDSVNLHNPAHVEKLIEVFEYLGNHKIPVLIHFRNNQEVFDRTDVEIFFDEILEKAGPQTIVFAHMAGDGLFNRETADLIDAILQQNGNGRHKLYFELSGAYYKFGLIMDELTDSEKLDIMRKIGFESILFGSDYPLISSREYLDLLKSRSGFSREELQLVLRNNPFH